MLKDIMLKKIFTLNLNSVLSFVMHGNKLYNKGAHVRITFSFFSAVEQTVWKIANKTQDIFHFKFPSYV